ncbi:MAG: twin-arginine translocation signal domain-containing protein, partial [Chloroflexaceae bacterium]|nr:twin-arginine translocation signal domain-containing protein [Chloroflexaceae bacterium]
MAKVTRRTFLKAAAGGAGATLLTWAGGYKIVFAQPAPVAYSLRILHTNDHHGRIEPEDADARTIRAANANATPPVTALTRNFGGVARRAKVIQEIKTANPTQNFLLLDAGDIFQGTLY